MSLLEELESRGVTAEDLEKAASVRLFEKAAAADGVDLDSLDVDQVEELYASFLTNPSYYDTTKEASAMNDEIVDLFEKTAASEGIDLDAMADYELAELYNHYVDNVLPLQIEEYEKDASAYEVDDAYEKLAEAEILGRHMARAYVDEFEKEARKGDLKMFGEAAKAEGRAAYDRGADAVSRGYAKAKDLASRGYAATERGARRAYDAAGRGARAYGSAITGRELTEAVKALRGKGRSTLKGAERMAMMRQAVRGGAKTTAAVGGTLAALEGGRRMLNKRSSIDDLIEERAGELAGEMLFNMGY